MRCLHQTLGSTKYKLQPGLILVSIEKKLPPSPFHARLTASYCNPWKMKARISLQIASSGMKMHELRRGPLFKSVFQLSLTGVPLRRLLRLLTCRWPFLPRTCVAVTVLRNKFAFCLGP